MSQTPRGPTCLTVRPPITDCTANLAQNPGFEVYGPSPAVRLLSPWTASVPEGGSVSSTAAPPPGGSGSAVQLSISSAADFAGASRNFLTATVSQSVSAEPGSIYSLSFTYYLQSPPPRPALLEVFCTIDSAASGAAVVGGPLNAWLAMGESQVQVLAGQSSPVSKLVCGITTNGPATVYLDQIVLKRSSGC